MSSAADKVTFEESIDQQDNSVLFQSKKYTYITDSSSNNGQFSGQLIFDLNTLSAQSQFVDLKEAIIQFPVKLSIKNAGTVGTTSNAAGILSATIKNGFHQFVDSVQVVLGGQTVQSSQIFCNINTTYKILSTWSKDTLQKYGDTLGVALDDWQVTNDTAAGVTDSLDNAAPVTTVGGFDITYGKNAGFKTRQLMNNSNSASNTLGKSILGTSQNVIGKSNVQSGTSKVTNEDLFVMYLMGTIRLKDISDFCANMVPCKNIKGFIYVNYNSSTHIILPNNGAATIASITDSTTYGRCAPAQLNVGVDGYAVTSNASNAASIFTAEISGKESSNLTIAKPIITNARLVAPYFICNPQVDRALTQRKKFRYNEVFTTQFSMTAGQNFNGTLTPGITNPTRVILYPYFTGPDSVNQNSTFVANPLISALDGVPSTTSPFAALKDLQFYVGNLPIWQSVVNYDGDNWLQEISTQGVDGGLNNEVSSGLLSARQFNQLYRYYTVDVSRRLDPSEDGCSRSIIVSCTNATLCPMNVIAIIWYQKEVEIDTASGLIEQKR